MAHGFIEGGWKNGDLPTDVGSGGPISPILLRIVRTALVVGVLIALSCVFQVAADLHRWWTAPIETPTPFLTPGGWICFLFFSAGVCLGTAIVMSARRGGKDPAVYLLKGCRCGGEELRRLYSASPG